MRRRAYRLLSLWGLVAAIGRGPLHVIRWSVRRSAIRWIMRYL